MMKRKYFTLMELALVLSVLMLGMVMTVSAVSRWKPSPAILTCAANLKKLGQAAFMYADDHARFLPGTGVMENNWKMKLFPYLKIGTAPEWDPAAYSVFHCPADKNTPPPYMQDVPVYRAKNSYCANFFIIDYDLEDKNGDSLSGGRNLKDLWGPDTIILFAEDHAAQNMVGLGPSVKWNRKGAFEYPARSSGRCHDLNRSNYLMLDGAVEYKEFEDTNTPEDLWLIRFGKNWNILN